MRDLYFTRLIPAPGECIEVVPGIEWVRMPLPFRLNHVNCWLLSGGKSLDIVDSGIDSDLTRDLWCRIIDSRSPGMPVARVIATHGHTDHVGAAGFLCDRYQARFTATLVEWQAACLRKASYEDGSVELRRFLHRHGCGEELMPAYLDERTRITRFLGPLPGVFTRLKEGDALSAGGGTWRVIMTGGHSDEHACLYDKDRKILLVGDQLLPDITPLVAVFHSMPDEDPLSTFFSSLDRLSGLPDDLLILPGHGTPYYGLHKRIRETRSHHDKRLDAASGFLKEPATAFDVAQKLFPSALKAGQGRLALGETLAHIVHLLKMGLANSERAADGRLLYRRL